MFRALTLFILLTLAGGCERIYPEHVPVVDPNTPNLNLSPSNIAAKDRLAELLRVQADPKVQAAVPNACKNKLWLSFYEEYSTGADKMQEEASSYGVVNTDVYGDRRLTYRIDSPAVFCMGHSGESFDRSSLLVRGNRTEASYSGMSEDGLAQTKIVLTFTDKDNWDLQYFCGETTEIRDNNGFVISTVTLKRSNGVTEDAKVERDENANSNQLESNVCQ